MADEPTKAELQDELRERDLPVSGNKDELAARLDEAVQSEEVAPELQVLEHLQVQEVEAREADPTVSALFAVEQEAAAQAVVEVEPDPSVQAMLKMLSDPAVPLEDKESALARAEEVGASAAVQQALLAHSAEANDEQPLTQRPVELVDPLEEGAGAGILVDTSHAGEEPGVVVRTQRRPGAPLTDEQADEATFPSGAKDRDALEDEVFVADEGEGPATLTQEVLDANRE
jgi:hypothetical protein